MPGFRGFANSLTAEEVTRLKNSDQVRDYTPTFSLLCLTPTYRSSISKSPHDSSPTRSSRRTMQHGAYPASQATKQTALPTPTTTAPAKALAHTSSTPAYTSSTRNSKAVCPPPPSPPPISPLTHPGATFLVDTSGENNLTDPYGHGTHTAGTIGSKTYGVAKKTKLYAVKVLDSEGGGTTEGIIAGFDFLVNNRTQDCPKGSVVNVSLGGSFSQALNDAVSSFAALHMHVGSLC